MREQKTGHIDSAGPFQTILTGAKGVGSEGQRAVNLFFVRGNRKINKTTRRARVFGLFAQLRNGPRGPFGQGCKAVRGLKTPAGQEVIFRTSSIIVGLRPKIVKQNDEPPRVGQSMVALTERRALSHSLDQRVMMQMCI